MNGEKPIDIMSMEIMEIDNTIFLEKVLLKWAQPIFSFLKEDILPDDEVMARQIVRRAKSYTIINNEP